jgi:hypothetical protein
MKGRYCYWTVVDGEHAWMAQSLVHSARRAGVFTDFHVWTDRPFAGAICHDAGRVEKEGCLFKLTFLRDAVRPLDYEYFVWLDADTWFVRHPGSIVSVLRGSPLHVTLESDLCREDSARRDWWGCPNHRMVELLRARGVRGRSVFNVNGGFFVVHRDAIETLFRLAYEFWQFGRGQGLNFNDEPLLAYAMQMLCGNPHLHTLRETAGVWASDWTGCFRDHLPDGQAWWFEDYFTREKIPVNPAIVHAMRSKAALLGAAATSAPVPGPQPAKPDAR